LDGTERRPMGLIRQRLCDMGLDTLNERSQDAENELFNLGITFQVYRENQAVDRILPFDVIPRVITPTEWSHLREGTMQRVTALNQFLHDIYHDQHLFRDDIVPKELVLGNSNYVPAMEGLKVKHGSYVNILGVDLVRDGQGVFRVLEDNCRVPSGVSYVVENRQLMQRAFPDLMDDIGVKNVADYGRKLHEALCDVAPDGVIEPQVVLLSPGTYNSAYFEHVFLAREMGVPLVEGSDLVVEDDKVFMKTITGLSPVHSIYRRLDDAFIDPEAFNPDSLLGVPGLMRAYAKGNVTLANAVGTGVADDKAIYAYMPRLIKYYLDQDPILESVPTHICREPEGLQYTLDHLDELVVKPVGEAGGYGIVIGPRSTEEQLEECRASLLDDPANYISQPVVPLSVSPTLTDDGIEPRHVDLRPFCVTGKSSWVLPGGLTRVALRKGSLIVNSSQGGGSKDTWVLES
ncbi:MAG: circularly permuted type 2 ATP-grasp protein, partial [Pseudomonadota bacterium]